MRQVKFFAIAAALLLGSTSLAATATSSSTSYDQATMQLEATGAAQEAVNFTVPNASITIPGSQVFPGNSFTVTIPVSNTSDRDIRVTVSDPGVTGDLAGKLTVTPVKTSADIVAGGSGSLSYTFTLADSVKGDQTIEGKAFTVTFSLTGTAINDGAKDSSF
ncbi:Hsp20/alpha crystallin family protein [Deinococcus petrolearius]|uniref:Hsp20/alpha crystallin family protein n=1 Tax=Deinococcus petrolearius TaxID=1751295 RepID=A0ABW1DF77_9DEIO